ncbi:MAG TPA: nickel pincer cofactor biosynthesis protein LarB [Thermoleophilia bacterium]|nr:nickel pincer cofactor biosynthesis protein LarB [Thermoleophilia bacterium]
MDRSLDDLFADVAAGRLSAADGAERLRRLGYVSVGDFALLDVSRAARKGVPEVVYAEGKTVEQVVAITRRFLEHDPVVLCSRVSEEQAAALAGVDGAVEHDPRSRIVVVRRADAPAREARGVVGVLAAGTSDVAVAGEAVAMIRAMGVDALTAFDVGVAGLHRLSAPLEAMREAGAGALVVAAGMEGALPSVVAGLAAVPVIGLPTSSGYGYGGRGEAALMGMLQSCSPGLAVVNIDNGVGAGATAALIARGAAG